MRERMTHYVIQRVLIQSCKTSTMFICRDFIFLRAIFYTAGALVYALVPCSRNKGEIILRRKLESLSDGNRHFAELRASVHLETEFLIIQRETPAGRRGVVLRTKAHCIA